jgi:hypothetical protein
METSTRFGLPPASSQEFALLVEELAQETAPRRFALCEVDSELPDARVFAWGLADDDGEAVVVGVEERLFGRFRSAESAHRLFSLARDCRLVWIDPEREEE